MDPLSTTSQANPQANASSSSAEAVGAPERCFVQADFDSLRVKHVYAIAKAQSSKWPSEGPPLNSKTSKDVLCSVLKNPRYGFTTATPLPDPSQMAQKRRGRPPNRDRDASKRQRTDHEPSSNQQQSIDTGNEPLAQSVTGAHKLASLQSLTVFVEDRRREVGSASRDIAQPLLVEATANQGTVGTWLVTSNELLQKLQASPAAISDPSSPISIQYAHHVDSKYLVYIARNTLSISPISPTEPIIFQTSPESGGGILYLCITSTSTGLKASDSTSLNHDEPSLSPKQDCSPKITRSSAPRQDRNNQVVESLRHTLSTRPGFDAFTRNKNKTLQNRDIVAHWKFIAEFFHAATRQKIGGKKVFNHHVQTALGLSETTVNQAVKATQLIAQQTDNQRAASFRQDVLDQLNAINDKPMGSTALFRFLESQQSIDHY